MMELVRTEFCDLYCGDCREILADIQADCVVTDPPYGLELGKFNDKRRDGSHLGKRGYENYRDTYDEFVQTIIPAIEGCLKIAKRGAVFSGPHIQEQRKASAIGGVYHRSAVGRTSWGFKNYLPILFYGNAPDLHGGHYPTVLTSTAVAEENGHPCPKPLEWMIWLVELASLEGEVVFDPFMGSGTTGVACVRTGRRFIGIELHRPYFDIAVRRIQEAEGKGSLFDAERMKQDADLFATA